MSNENIQFVVKHAEEKAVETSEKLILALCPKNFTKELKEVWEESYKNYLFSIIKPKIIREAESKGFLDSNSGLVKKMKPGLPAEYLFPCFNKKQINDLKETWKRSYNQGCEECEDLKNEEVYS